jgi:hypothetical protein
MQAGQAIPVYSEQPSVYNPIHEDDYIAQLPGLLAIASVPATTVNWGGEPVALEEWCRYLGELTHLEPRFRISEHALAGIELDVSQLGERVGAATVSWRDGVRRMVEARAPELLLRAR